MTNDRRTDEERAATLYYIVATDSFMSGWGHAPGRSLYALAITSDEQEPIVTRNLEHRSEMKRVRRNLRLPRLRSGDHLSIAGPTEAGRHYQSGGF